MRTSTRSSLVLLSLALCSTPSLQAVSLNHAPSFALPPLAPVGEKWVVRGASKLWQAVASSADGTKLAAVTSNGSIYTSTDGGATWTGSGPSQSWSAIASSADGTVLVATPSYGQIQISTDSGATWTPKGDSRPWTAITCSTDGVKFAGTTNYGLIYTSADSGETWTTRLSANSWGSIASSADGTKLAAAPSYGQISTSPDSGENWIQQGATTSWRALASSADGVRLAAIDYSTGIHISNDQGATWTQAIYDPFLNHINSSADGSRLIATRAYASQLRMSGDSGATWSQKGPFSEWRSITSSTDGKRVVAAAGPQGGGQIFTSEEETLPSVIVPINSGLQTRTGFASSISPGPAYESSQTVSFTVTSATPALFSAQPAISANGDLTFTPALDASGTAEVTVFAWDSGGTQGGGQDTSPAQTFHIIIEPNQAPSDISLSTQSVLDGTLAGTTIALVSVVDANPGDTHTLSFVDGPGAWNNNLFTIRGNELKPLQAVNRQSFGSDTFSVRIRATDSAGNFGEHDFGIQILTINQAPSFNLPPGVGEGPPSVAVATNSGAFIRGNFATSILAGPYYENQSVSFLVDNTDNALFELQPKIDPSGALTFTPAPDATGVCTVTVVAKDNGGTDNGGIDTSAPKTFTIRIRSNTAPTDIALSSESFPENNSPGDTVSTLAATDADSIEEHTFTLVAGEGDTDNAGFQVSGNALAFRSVADYETRNSYSIRLRVADAVGATFEKSFALTVTDNNDAPAFTLPYQQDEIGKNWTPHEFDRTWRAVASSADGKKLAAVVSYGNIHTSADGGLTWVEHVIDTGVILEQRSQPGIAAREAGGANWSCITSSADGTHLAAGAQLGSLFTSNDSGATWVECLAEIGGFNRLDWRSIDSSADGMTIVATANQSGIYISTDGGATWTLSLVAEEDWWAGVTVSADGQRIAAAPDYGPLAISSDGGATWESRAADNREDPEWSAITSSPDGLKIALTGGYGILSISADGGETWDLHYLDTWGWPVAVTISADGTHLAALAQYGSISTSSDCGVTWTTHVLPNDYEASWAGLAASADGTRLAAVARYAPIYTSIDRSTYRLEIDVTSASTSFAREGFVTDVIPGPPAESGQAVDFLVTNDNPELFSQQPAIDEFGALTFTRAAEVTGEAIVTVRAHDNGGTANGGLDTSPPQTFFIKIAPPPVLEVVRQDPFAFLADGVGATKFGGLPVGNYREISFSFTNTGGLDLTGLELTSDGPAAEDFDISPIFADEGGGGPIILGRQATGSGGTTRLAPGESAHFSVRFSPSSVGQKTATLHIASNLSGEANPFDIQLSGEGLSNSMADWASEHFGLEFENTGSDDDFDHDRIPNLLEFAFGTSPASSDSGPAELEYDGTFAGNGTIVSKGQPITKFQSIPNSIDFRAVFIRRSDYLAAGLVYTPEFSSNMSLWQASTATPVVLADDGTHQVVSVPYTRFIAGKKARFFRIKVTIATPAQP